MSNLSPHRRFVDPGNTDGIPQVRPHGPMPVRKVPLPGTKSMRTPHDGSLGQVIKRTMENDESPNRAAKFMGYLAVAGVVVFLCMLWFISRGEGIDIRRDHGGLFTMLIILGLGGIHVAAIFSQIFSNGRNMPGVVSLLMLYVGSILLMVVDHLLR